jgi:hypothetical protein
MLTVTSPSTLFCTKSDLSQALELLNGYRNHTLPADTDPKRLWRAKQIKDAMMHPQSGEVIPVVFRMSAFMPINIVICKGLMIPNAGVGSFAVCLVYLLEILHFSLKER